MPERPAVLSTVIGGNAGKIQHPLIPFKLVHSGTKYLIRCGIPVIFSQGQTQPQGILFILGNQLFDLLQLLYRPLYIPKGLVI